MSAPGTYNLTVYRGDTLVLDVVLTDTTTGLVLDLTGYSALAQIRATADAASADASLAAVLTPAEGKVTLTLSAAASAALTITTGVWDLQLTDGSGVVRTYLAGSVTVTPDVSRS